MLQSEIIRAGMVFGGFTVRGNDVKSDDINSVIIPLGDKVSDIKLS